MDLKFLKKIFFVLFLQKKNRPTTDFCGKYKKSQKTTHPTVEPELQRAPSFASLQIDIP
jgi:hypothetical protein